MFVLLLLTIVVLVAANQSSFVGMYSDPNHPDCFRKIVEKPNEKYDVYGADNAGGEGVSCNTDDKSQIDAWGPLPASINTTTILVDFTSKGGPSNLAGTWDAVESKILWEDGNYWQHL